MFFDALISASSAIRLIFFGAKSESEDIIVKVRGLNVSEMDDLLRIESCDRSRTQQGTLASLKKGKKMD